MEHAVANGLHKGKKAEENSQAKFKNQEVEIYRKRFHSGLVSAKSIAKFKGVSTSVVYLMLSGQTYSSVDGPISTLSTRKKTKKQCRKIPFTEAKEKFGISRVLWEKFQ